MNVSPRATLAWLASTLLVVAPSAARAHTESDVVAVPASEAATVRLAPTHGCGESPTVAVRTRVPIADARAEPVEGWTATATPDGAGNVVVEWTGGVLPADEAGAFPVTFTTPDTVGELLTFPFIQVCEDGEELAWIDGDPASEYPAPRVLVLAAGSDAAATIDEVPADAPGRELLTAVADVDNPAATTIATTTTTTTTTTTIAGPAGTVDATTAPLTDGSTASTSGPTEPPTAGSGRVPAGTAGATTAGGGGDDEDDDSSGVVRPAVIGLVAVAVVGGAAVVLRRRSRAA